MADKTVNNVVRLLELMDIAPGSYDEETALDAIALIKAQQAEIERLRAENAKQRAWIVTLEMQLKEGRWPS